MLSLFIKMNIDYKGLLTINIEHFKNLIINNGF